MLYTNDPKAVVTGRAGFGITEDGNATALLGLDFAVAPERQKDFRWALIGRENLIFNAEMETVVKGDPASVRSGQLVTRSLKTAQPIKRSKSCEGGKITLDEEVILVGGLGNAYLLTTDGAERVDPGSMLTILHFPRLRPMRSGEEYTLNIGSMGKPSDIDRGQLGPLEFERIPTCVDLGETDDVGKAGKLSIQDATWKVNVSPENPGDKSLLISPTPTNIGPPEWSFNSLTQPKVAFLDKALQQIHQASLFIGGIFAGIATNFLVQGITGLTGRQNGTHPKKKQPKRQVKTNNS